MAAASDTAPAPVTPMRVRTSGAIRARLKDAKLAAVDSAMEKGDSWAKKILSGDCGVMLNDIEPLLSALGLKAVDAAKVCVDRATVEAFEQIARRAMAKQPTLIWDDAE